MTEASFATPTLEEALVKNRASTRAQRVRFVLLAGAVLLVAMASSATAGALITGKNIKDGSVTGRDLRDGSVKGIDVKDFSLSIDDFTGSVQGPQGPAGAAGPAGPRGPAGFSGILYQSVEMVLPGGQARTWSVACPAGTKAAGGGVSTNSYNNLRVTESAPLNDGIGWAVGARNVGVTSITTKAWAACVTAP